MKLLTYGTLQKGQHNHGLLRGAKFLGEAHTGPGYRLVIKGLPFLLEDPTGEGCYGELYEITNLQLKRIDYLEGHDLWYVRKEIDVYCNDEVHKAFCYIMPPDRI